MNQFWNCGCSKWMHGTEDACDNYLPELKPAPTDCPLVSKYASEQQAKLIRSLAERTRNDLMNMGVSNFNARELANSTATGLNVQRALLLQQSVMQAYDLAQQRDDRHQRFLESVGLAGSGLFGHGLFR